MTMMASSYRLSIYLTTAVTLAMIAVFASLAVVNFGYAQRATIFVAGSVGVVAGLWLNSNIVRYLGAAFLMVFAGAIFLPYFSSERIVLSLLGVLFFLAGALSFVSSMFLLFSRALTIELGPVAELVGIECGVVSGVINLETSGVEASDWRPRHDEHYHEACFFASCSRDGC